MTGFRDVPRGEYGAFLQRAEEWLDAAEWAAGGRRYNAAVSSSAECAIRAIDAAGVALLGKRSAGRHGDALSLARSVFAGRERAGVSRLYGPLPNMKDEAERGPTMMTGRHAADALRRARRILEMARGEIARQRG